MNLPGLNIEQSKQLYRFLANLTSASQPKTSEQEVNVANMAGISPRLSNTYNTNAICCSSQLGNDNGFLILLQVTI